MDKQGLRQVKSLKSGSSVKLENVTIDHATNIYWAPIKYWHSSSVGFTAVNKTDKVPAKI